jgi:hypothetical protein
MCRFRSLLTCTSLSLCVAIPTAYAQPELPTCEGAEGVQFFTSTGSLQTYDVPAGVSTVLIDAYGAAGGNETSNDGPSYDGGLGAHVVAEVPVTASTTLNVVVGEQGSSPVEFFQPAGGGGASAVSTSGGTPLVVAGAGGGAGITEDGDDAQLGEDGSDGGGSGGAGGTMGNGGMASAEDEPVGGGGGGWLTAGETSASTGAAAGGHALSGDAAGGAAGEDGAAGGYGGGGGSAGPSGGGGGGYGGGGTAYGEGIDGAGGGGSFVAEGAVQSFMELSGSQGDGQVTICVGPSSVPVMPWASLALLGLGLLAAGGTVLKKRLA